MCTAKGSEVHHVGPLEQHLELNRQRVNQFQWETLVYKVEKHKLKVEGRVDIVSRTSFDATTLGRHKITDPLYCCATD